MTSWTPGDNGEKKIEKISMLRISMLRKMTKVRIWQSLTQRRGEERRGEDKPIYIVGRPTKNIIEFEELLTNSWLGGMQLVQYSMAVSTMA